MKKILVIVSLLLSGIAFAQMPVPTIPPMSCESFLKNELVQDQLNEVFGDSAQYNVQYDQQKNICTLSVTGTKQGKDYKFSTISSDNFLLDGKSLTLSLFAADKPQCLNVLEADYADNTIVDVSYAFPYVDNTCDK
ncbi:MAG: hypothetical protein KKA99_00260 [Gammaproteobacteria bacterium]|nr:hypothetical protein [Gammaproteobacteria bacterium]MBU1558388.1 hypothetical protein [Gammaproteobacteria bacterium]MBU1628557.1 hypothetical protein [Gammaproteobacteria bacterium]MBU1926436.1 hypothetical protein [Gammaproteobacteria bacterium]MBU2545718.1 hypothetical protein [Gammaproteobacteria bacterium]